MTNRIIDELPKGGGIRRDLPEAIAAKAYGVGVNTPIDGVASAVTRPIVGITRYQ